jgi:hypothetical protein
MKVATDYSDFFNEINYGIMVFNGMCMDVYHLLVRPLELSGKLLWRHCLFEKSHL